MHHQLPQQHEPHYGQSSLNQFDRMRQSSRPSVRRGRVEHQPHPPAAINTYPAAVMQQHQPASTLLQATATTASVPAGTMTGSTRPVVISGAPNSIVRSHLHPHDGMNSVTQTSRVGPGSAQQTTPTTINVALLPLLNELSQGMSALTRDLVAIDPETTERLGPLLGSINALLVPSLSNLLTVKSCCYTTRVQESLIAMYNSVGGVIPSFALALTDIVTSECGRTEQGHALATIFSFVMNNVFVTAAGLLRALPATAAVDGATPVPPLPSSSVLSSTNRPPLAAANATGSQGFGCDCNVRSLIFGLCSNLLQFVTATVHCLATFACVAKVWKPETLSPAITALGIMTGVLTNLAVSPSYACVISGKVLDGLVDRVTTELSLLANVMSGSPGELLVAFITHLHGLVACLTGVVVF